MLRALAESHSARLHRRRTLPPLRSNGLSACDRHHTAWHAGRLVEVYPHPALLALLKRNRRVPYNIGKASSYWKGASIAERIDRLLAEFAVILGGLATVIDGIAIPLPRAADFGSLSALKPLEDAIDALVCCWVGVEYLAGRCQPLGDDTAAIWCPRT